MPSRTAASLPRLGKHERRVLLAAPPPDGDSVVVPPAGPGRAADEANRRAIRQSLGSGLLWVGWQATEVETKGRAYSWGRWRPVVREYHKRAVWLSPLGQAVVNLARPELQSGRPIRWEKYRAAAVAECRRPPTR